MKMSIRFASLLCLVACTDNQSGNLGTTKLGDTSHPLTPGSPIADQRAACGEGALLDSAVHREPYLQQVTETSAMIGWVTTGATVQHVDISTPSFESLSSVDGVLQADSLRRGGEQQMWATIGGLSARTIECYTLEADGTTLTEPIGFRTAPPLDSADPIRFLAFGDSGGGGADQLELRDRMLEYPYDLIIHTGDVAYDDGTIDQFDANVFGVYPELFKHLPFYPAAGNHEYNTLAGAPFREVFALPGTEKWYSYDWGRVHFAALDTEADYATQMAWLDQDLAATDRPWKIVYM
ncbi:MAG: metallophosphoesterase, partial [Deltaproteobacteria bacterium]|nr:metallophosphoesterase [Deltaproteobacteria bacterium]